MNNRLVMMARTIFRDIEHGVNPLTLQVEELVREVLDIYEDQELMIGQRVIYRNTICIVCVSEETGEESNDKDIVWIDNPRVGYRHWVSKFNVKPLPGGQL